MPTHESRKNNFIYLNFCKNIVFINYSGIDKILLHGSKIFVEMNLYKDQPLRGGEMLNKHIAPTPKG